MSLKVLMVASEVSPFAKSGGLGDVTGSLPKALQNAGVEICVVFPKYKSVKQEYVDSAEYITGYDVTLDWRVQYADIFKLKADVPTYMIGNDFYFGNRDGYYGYGDDCERFTFFSKAALEMINYIDFIPDVIHTNDWQTGLVSLYLKDKYSKISFYQNIKSLYTIHNLQYQGVFPSSCLSLMELDYGYLTSDKLEFYGTVNLMKGGLVYADAINTVSNTYAEEVKRPEYGYQLDGVMRSRDNVLYGIVNGIDYEENNPATSKKIFVNYDVNSIEKKKENKFKLQEELGLPVCDVPMISIISRLADQKGINLLLDIAGELLSKDVQLVILGTGNSYFEYRFRELQSWYPKKVSANITFNDTLAQKIYAGSDIFLMPSLFEPCGLGQLFAMSYGTIPVVRTTGGLVDTVEHYNPETGKGNGFKFQDFLGSGLMWGINEALRLYEDKEQWTQIMKNAINTRFSWDVSAQEYIKLYKMLCNKED
ncbi:MAG: glycogen synthase GlgA [Clostridiales bacterium]|nr:glycogen synthase GlgA [Clostridiales bacterium]